MKPIPPPAASMQLMPWRSVVEVEAGIREAGSVGKPLEGYSCLRVFKLVENGGSALADNGVQTATQTLEVEYLPAPDGFTQIIPRGPNITRGKTYRLRRC